MAFDIMTICVIRNIQGKLGIHQDIHRICAIPLFQGTIYDQIPISKSYTLSEEEPHNFLGPPSKDIVVTVLVHISMAIVIIFFGPYVPKIVCPAAAIFVSKAISKLGKATTMTNEQQTDGPGVSPVFNALNMRHPVVSSDFQCLVGGAKQVRSLQRSHKVLWPKM